MSEVTGSLVVLKFIIDGLARDDRLAPDAQVTISQRVIDATALALRSVADVDRGRLDNLSIGFKNG